MGSRLETDRRDRRPGALVGVMEKPWRWGFQMAGGCLLALGLQGMGLLPAAAETVDELTVWESLPQNTALVVSLNTTESAWEDLDRFRIVQLLNENFGMVPNPVGLPYLPYSIDYPTYIQPWVGDGAVVALLPSLGGLPADMADHLVMLAPIVDQAAFDNYFQVLQDGQRRDPTVETFRQTDIYFWPAEPQPTTGESLDSSRPATKTLSFAKTTTFSVEVTKALPEGDRTFDLNIPLPVPEVTASGLAVAVLPDTLIAAEHPTAIKTFLRYRQDDQEALADHPQFQRTLDHGRQANALVTVYGNTLELLNFNPPDMPLDASGWPIPAGPVPPAMINTLRGLNFGGTLEALVFPVDRGVQLQGRLYYDATPFTFGLTPQVPWADSVLEQLPAATYLVISGRDLAGVWRQVTQIVEQLGADLGNGLDAVRDGFTALTGLDLDRDIFGWLDQEIAVAAFPATDTPLQVLSPQLQVGLGVLMQTSDRPTAENTLATADELLTSLGLGVTAATVNGQPVTSWELWSDRDTADAPQQSFVSHGWVTDDTVAIVSGLGPMERVMHPTPHDGLGNFPLFRNAIRDFPNPNNGYFYVNLGATLALVYQLFDLHGEPSFQPFKAFLGSFSTISATTAQTADYIEVDAQLGLARREH